MKTCCYCTEPTTSCQDQDPIRGERAGLFKHVIDYSPGAVTTTAWVVSRSHLLSKDVVHNILLIPLGLT